MSIAKEAKGFGMPWEDDYGYAQALKVGSTIYFMKIEMVQCYYPFCKKII